MTCSLWRNRALPAGRRSAAGGVRRERDGVAYASAKSCKTSVAKSSLLDFMTELQPIARSANGGTVQCSETSDYKTHQKHHRIP